MRALSAEMQAAVIATTGEVCWFLELQLGSGPLRLTTARSDVAWDGWTWEGVGGLLTIDPLPESTDGRSAGVQLSLSGVNPAILSLVLAETFRGRAVRVWLGHFDATTGQLVPQPVALGSFLMLDAFQVRETTNRDGSTVTISTRVATRQALLRLTRGIRCNPPSHRAALRVPAPAGWDTDTFFAPTAALATKAIEWGSKRYDPPAPAPPGRFPSAPAGSPAGPTFGGFPVPRPAPRR